MSVVHNAVHQTVKPPNDGVSGKSQTQLALELNSCRIVAVAEQLAMSAQLSDQPFKFHQLCLSLARGIDYGLANNEVPAAASTLPHVLKMVCYRKNEVALQAGIMVLMISVKNACKLGWFTAKDTEELLTLADEVSSFFVTKKDVNAEVCASLPIVSSIMSRFYPRFKLGNIIASFEAEPGYGTHLVDFHISKDIAFSKEERIRLFVAMKDNIDTSSCIVTPQQVNILLNGKPVEHRNSVLMDHGPQLPTVVNPSLKYGINLLQVMGQFNGHYILIVAVMSVIPSSGLQPPVDYVQPASAVSNSDAEIIEGPSRVSLRCPISKTRIKTPVKGNSCKHYQCFDYNNYVEINFKRPSWRCPSCNQSVCYTDLRVDQKMVKALQEVGENVSEVIISVDGTWTAASSDKHKDELQHNSSANQQEGQVELSSGMNASDNMCDLTGEDDEMDTDNRSEPVDTKPLVHLNAPGQSAPSKFTPPPASRSTIELTQYSSGQAVNSASPRAMFNSGSVGFNFRPHAQVGGLSGTLAGNGGITPVLTDAVSPALNRQSDNLQGTNRSPSSIYSQSSAPVPTSLQLQEALLSHGLRHFPMIPRNVTRDPNAIQALPVPTTPQQHSRPTVSSPAGSGSAPFQRSVSGSNARAPGPFSSNVERQRPLSQPYVGPRMSNMSSHLLNRSASAGLGHPNPSLNMPMPQTLSQPPHLMRTSQLPRNHVQPGVGPRMSVNNSPSTLQRVQLTPQQTSHVRQQPQTIPLQTQAARMTSSLPLNSAVTAVTRAENLIDAQPDHNWRPIGRMRGALTGKAYSDALNQYMSGQAAQPVQTSSPRPPVSPASSLPSSVNNNVLLANRRIASELQPQSVPVSGTVNTQEDGSPGVN